MVFRFLLKGKCAFFRSIIILRVKMGWLIDISAHKVYIYRLEVGLLETKTFEEGISGEEILPNFMLNFNFIDEK